MGALPLKSVLRSYAQNTRPSKTSKPTAKSGSVIVSGLPKSAAYVKLLAKRLESGVMTCLRSRRQLEREENSYVSASTAAAYPSFTTGYLSSAIRSAVRRSLKNAAAEALSAARLRVPALPPMRPINYEMDLSNVRTNGQSRFMIHEHEVRHISGGDMRREARADLGNRDTYVLERLTISDLTFHCGNDVIDRVKDAMFEDKPLKFTRVNCVYTCYVAKWMDMSMFGQPDFVVTLRPTGPPEIQRIDITTFSDREPRYLTKEQTVNKRLKKVVNPYYCAHPNVLADKEQGDQRNELAVGPNDRGAWTRPSLKDALDHAQQQLDNDPSLEQVAVVRIVKLVRRKRLPHTIEDVRG